LTPRPLAGGSAIAVIRLRGPRVPEFISKYFSRPPVPGKCVHGELHDGNAIIDDCLVVIDPPKQFADISLHGGAWVVESVLKLASREGFEIQKPSLPLGCEALDDSAGELEREMLEYLPLALTEPAIRILLNQPAAWREALKIGMDPADILKNKTLPRLLHPPTIAIIGEPNVGKSTLANRLFGQQRSITADLPGTTRDWVGEMADINGLPAILIDTPGLRETQDPIEAAAINASAEKIREADLLIIVLDATDSSLSSQSAPPSKFVKPSIVVINKIDRAISQDFSAVDAIRISAKTGDGIANLCRAIHLGLGIDDLNVNRARWWTERHREILGSESKSAEIYRRILG
jgi:small GTP-binding protein